MSLADIKDMTPNPGTVKMLEKMLKEANAGELRTVIVVCGWDDNSWSHGWVVDPRNTRHAMIGEVTMTGYDIATQVAIDSGDTVISMALDP